MIVVSLYFVEGFLMRTCLDDGVILIFFDVFLFFRMIMDALFILKMIYIYYLCSKYTYVFSICLVMF